VPPTERLKGQRADQAQDAKRKPKAAGQEQRKHIRWKWQHKHVAQQYHVQDHDVFGVSKQRGAYAEAIEEEAGLDLEPEASSECPAEAQYEDHPAEVLRSLEDPEAGAFKRNFDSKPIY